MSDKVQYSIINAENGNISVQSTVKSFNLDHVTEKDIVSFYNNFSQYAAWDTGLLPVDGSGILAIRTAGEYTQFAYQHKPGLYHINWAAQEGGAATPYYLAQPYRIIICDMHNGNLLGARTFYSPYPITSPTQQLYHVNLPNINCRGYRGNGVGWICLYHNDDWSELPLNERIVRFIERCSGVETYNDGNMSETDGPRFYQLKNKPAYLWDPQLWQQKSADEGYEWTLNEDLWIPILVESMDSQGKHVDNGVPLTLADALVGDYRAYYYDDKVTKPINAIIRPDKNIDSNEVMTYFVQSYNRSTKKTNSFLNDTFNASIQLKDKIGSVEFKGSVLINAPSDHNDSNEDEDEDNYECSCCGEYYSDLYATDADTGEGICEGCCENSYVFIESASGYYHCENSNIIYDESSDFYYHTEYDTVLYCDNCGSVHARKSNSPQAVNFVRSRLYHYDGDNFACIDCIQSYVDNNPAVKTAECFVCKTLVIDSASSVINNMSSVPDEELDYTQCFPQARVNIPFFDFEKEQESFSTELATFCPGCALTHKVCPCGKVKNENTMDFNTCTPTVMTDPYGNKYIVDQACATCLGPVDVSVDPPTANYVPLNIDLHKAHYKVNSPSEIVVGIKPHTFIDDAF